MIEKLRNVAIIAHVDHGKTTLVDKLLQQSGTLGRKDQSVERILDSNDQEKERGITILAKNTAIDWQGYHINIVDTPGHADFGGEVERVLSMVDSVLLLVDAVDGPMPQTRFVTQKAFEKGLKPILVVNKIDRPGARPDWVVDEVFDLFDNLGATDDQLDFPIIYASAIQGVAGLELDDMAEDMSPVFEMLIKHVAFPNVDRSGPFQMQISALDYDSYVGVIGIGKVTRGEITPNTQVRLISVGGEERNGRILNVLGYKGLETVELERAGAGDIIRITGFERLNISDTICATDCVEVLPALQVDEPTVSVTFQVNDSPFAGKEGKYVTSRNIKERLEKELLHNVALRVEPGSSAEKFKVSGRGELHLAVLIETMRREGYELAVSRPEVVVREVDGKKQEPYEQVVADVEEQHQGAVMEALGARKADLQNMVPDNKGRVRLDYIMPARSLIGFRSAFMNMTSGSGILNSLFYKYDSVKEGNLNNRTQGVIISMVTGKVLGYALWNLQERGRLFVAPNVEVYEGQVIGLHNRENDLTVNPTKGKQLTNVRASGTDDNIVLTPHQRFTLEQALEFINDDELVEVTPETLRIRKKHLTEVSRRRAGRS